MSANDRQPNLRLNLDILAAALPYLTSHDLTIAMRTCKAIHTYGLPYLISEIGSGVQRKLLFLTTWDILFSTMEVNPAVRMKYVRSLTTDMYEQDNYQKRLSILITYATNLIHLEIRWFTFIAREFADAVCTHLSSLRKLSFKNFWEDQMHILREIKWPLTSLNFEPSFPILDVLDTDLKREASSPTTSEAAISPTLNGLSSFTSSLEELSLNFFSYDFADDYFNKASHTILFPRVRRLHFENAHPKRLSTLCRAFPALREFTHRIIKSRAHLFEDWMQRSQQASHILDVSKFHGHTMWPELDRVVIALPYWYAEPGITCPIRFFDITILTEGTIDDVARARLFAANIKLARPVVLKLFIKWKGNEMLPCLEWMMQAAAPEMRCLRLFCSFAEHTDALTTGIELTRILPDVLASTQISHLFIGDDIGIAAFYNRETNSLEPVPLRSWNTRDMQDFVTALATAVTTLEQITVLHYQEIIHGWEVRRDSEGAVVGLITLLMEKAVQYQRDALAFQRVP